MVHAAGRLSGERVSELHSSEIWSVALFATPTGINETPVNKPLCIGSDVLFCCRLPDSEPFRIGFAALPERLTVETDYAMWLAPGTKQGRKRTCICSCPYLRPGRLARHGDGVNGGACAQLGIPGVSASHRAPLWRLHAGQI